MLNMMYVKSLAVVVLVVLSGCATSIQSTLQTAQAECEEVKAIITNKDGTEGITIRCTWTEETSEW